MSINCCYNCNERHINCHSECERYAKFKAEKEEQRLQRIEEGKLRCKTIGKQRDIRRKLRST